MHVREVIESIDCLNEAVIAVNDNFTIDYLNYYARSEKITWLSSEIFWLDPNNFIIRITDDAPIDVDKIMDIARNKGYECNEVVVGLPNGKNHFSAIMNFCK